MGFTLKIRYHVQFIQALVEALAGNAYLSLEGDLSRCAADIERVPGMSRQGTATLRRNTLVPQGDFAILPIEPTTQERIICRILPRVGVHCRVWHVCLQKDDALQFAAFDTFQYSYAGDAIPEELLKTLVDRGVLRSYQRVENGAAALPEG